jgi:hypothetical protein
MGNPQFHPSWEQGSPYPFRVGEADPLGSCVVDFDEQLNAVWKDHEIQMQISSCCHPDTEISGGK